MLIPSKLRWNKVLRDAWLYKGSGTLLSYPLGNLLSGGVGMAFVGLWIEYTFSYTGVWVWFGVVIAVSALASLAPARRASRISAREALAYERVDGYLLAAG